MAAGSPGQGRDYPASFYDYGGELRSIGQPQLAAPFNRHRKRTGPSSWGRAEAVVLRGPCRGATRHGSDCELKFCFSVAYFGVPSVRGELQASRNNRYWPVSIPSGLI